MKRQKILGVFGEEAFPRHGKGFSKAKRQRALSNITGCLAELRPELVYMIPTTGTCLEFLALLNILNFPYILVIPYRDFISIPSPEYKLLIKQATIDAKNIIVLDTSNSFKGKPHTIAAAIKYIMEVSDKILVVNSPKGENSKHIKLVNSLFPFSRTDEPINLVLDL
jgi:hypothetical protein